MPFQNTVRRDQATGIVGDLVIGGPVRGQPGILASSDATNNVVGRALRHLAGEDLKVSADVATGAFAGILANSKIYALLGNTSGTLEPDLTLPNETMVQLITMTSGILVSLSTAAAIGHNVFYATATGVLAAAAGNTLADHVMIPRAKIVRCNTTPGLAIVELT